MPSKLAVPPCASRQALPPCLNRALVSAPSLGAGLPVPLFLRLLGSRLHAQVASSEHGVRLAAASFPGLEKPVTLPPVVGPALRSRIVSCPLWGGLRKLWQLAICWPGRSPGFSGALPTDWLLFSLPSE